MGEGTEKKRKRKAPPPVTISDILKADDIIGLRQYLDDSCEAAILITKSRGGCYMVRWVGLDELQVIRIVNEAASRLLIGDYSSSF